MSRRVSNPEPIVPITISAPCGRRWSRSATFTVIVAVMVLFQAAASAPTPLYIVYQRMWGFSPATLTLVFAAFVLVLLGTLLVTGRLSDHLGRRPVLLAAIMLEMVSLALFMWSRNLTMLLTARLVQGIATGLALPALSAGLVDAEPPDQPGRAATVNGVIPIAGLAVGSLACGALVQYGPDPTRLIWALLLGAAALAVPAVLALPDLSSGPAGTLRSLVPRLGVPSRLRRDAFRLVPIIVASWALGGLYLSLGPSATATVFGVTNHFLGGMVATVLCGTGAAAAFGLRRCAGPALPRITVVLLATGTAVTLSGVLSHAFPLAAAGTVVAGIGYGTSGLTTFGALATLAGPVDPVERGQLFATAYTVAYLAFSVPAVAAGFTAQRLGLSATLVGYCLVVILVAATALCLQGWGPARASTSPAVQSRW